MPFETVQYPNTSPETTGTEVTVHWASDGYVQLEVARHVWSPLAPGETGTTAEWDQNKARTVEGIDTPLSQDRPPLGAIKAQDGEIAVKIGEMRKTSEDGNTGWVEGIWQVTKVPEVMSSSMRGLAAVDLVTEDHVAFWPIVWAPGGYLIAQHVYTEVLDRGQINKMIRTLRRARDSAYGSDA